MEAYNSQAELLKALAHPVRLQILDLLRDGEQCVCHMEAVLRQRQSYISQHLMLLRKVGLVADRKDGLRVYYSVRDPSVYAVPDVARSLASRQAQKQGHTLSFALPQIEPGGVQMPQVQTGRDPLTGSFFAPIHSVGRIYGQSCLFEM